MQEDIFSEREDENRLCFNYFKFPQAFRVELLDLVEKTASPAIIEGLVQVLSRGPGAQYFGVDILWESAVKQFIFTAPSVCLLDLIEQFIRMYHESWGNNNPVERTQELTAAINELFEKYNLGYGVVGQVLKRRDSRYFHAKVVRKVYSLLFAAGFEQALAAFERAIEAMKGESADYRQTVRNAEAALAFTLKELLRRYKDSGETHRMSLSELLSRAETLSAFPRQALEAGRMAAHTLGTAEQMIQAEAGTRPPKPGDYLPAHACANFALNVTGAYIIFLLQLNKDLIASGRLSEWDLFD